MTSGADAALCAATLSNSVATEGAPFVTRNLTRSDFYCMGVFCFSFALLCDTYHECAAEGSLAVLISGIGMCIGDCGTSGTTGTSGTSGTRQYETVVVAEAPAARRSRAASPLPPRDLCMRTCAWLCSVAHITGRHTLVPFIFVSLRYWLHSTVSHIVYRDSKWTLSCTTRWCLRHARCPIDTMVCCRQCSLVAFPKL